MMRRSWIIVGVTLLLIIGAVFAWRTYHAIQLSTEQTIVVPNRTPQEIQQGWEQGVQQMVQDYQADKNAAKARDALLKLTVPGDQRETHLALVLALESLVQNRPTANTQWQEALRRLPPSLVTP